MKWIIRTAEGGVLHHSNNQFLVFDTPYDAMKHIDESCGSSPYLYPQKLHQGIEII